MFLLSDICLEYVTISEVKMTNNEFAFYMTNNEFAFYITFSSTKPNEENRSQSERLRLFLEYVRVSKVNMINST